MKRFEQHNRAGRLCSRVNLHEKIIERKSMNRNFYLTIVSLLFGAAICISTAKVEAIPLSANFSLFGEVYRFNPLAFGDLNVQVSLNDNILAEGAVTYGVTTAPVTTGIFSAISFPDSGDGYKVIDFDFSVPFDLEIGQEANFEVGLSASAIRLVLDFSDNIYWGGSLLEFTPGQGLILNSVTLTDGSPLSNAGLEFKFIPENTLLSAFVTNGTNQPRATALPPNVAQANADNVAFAFAGLGSDSLLQLGISPEPNPLIWDFGCASLGTRVVDGCGGFVANPNNVVLATLDNSVPVPEPASLLLFSTGLVLFGASRRLLAKCC